MRTRLPLLVLVCTAQFVDVLDVNAVLVALPPVGRDLGLARGDLQWVVTAYVLVFAGCLLVAGRLADALGRRRVFAAGIGLFSAASLACGVAPSAPALVLARAAQGLGAALSAPAALAMIVDAFPSGRARERAVAAWTGVAAAGGATGIVLGGLITSALGWRWVFLVNVPVGLVALALTPRLLPARHAARPAHGLDLPGAVTATCGLALLVLALADAERSPGVALAALAAAGILLCTFVVRERSAADPLVPPAIIRARPVAGAVLAAALLTATTSGGAVMATLHLQDVLGMDPAGAALVLLPLSIAVVAGSVAATRVRTGPPAVIGCGIGLVAAGSAAAAAGITATSGVAAVALWGVLAGFGLGAASVAATTLGASAVAEADRGTAAGVLNTAAQVGTALGVAALVLVADTTAPATGHRLGFAAAALAAAIGASLSYRCRGGPSSRSRRTRPAAPWRARSTATAGRPRAPGPRARRRPSRPPRAGPRRS
jgi:MFS family permease